MAKNPRSAAARADSIASGGRTYKIAIIALERTVRLVASARLRDPVLLKLVARDELAELEEIESATSARLATEQRGAESLDARELVAGIAHANFVNAAFAYFRSRALNRFNGPGRGAWYSALTTQTCVAEVTFHMTRELRHVNDFNAIVDYAELFASFAGLFVDLRGAKPAPPCLHADPAVGYPAGNALAAAAITSGVNGIVYPSVRHKGGICLVALFPQAVQSVTQGGIVRLTWRGQAEPAIAWV